MKYYYETHLHTKEASACASCSGEEYPVAYKKLGYAGIIVTDHFLNGTTTIDPNLPWEEKINRFCLGYENAKRVGDQIGLDVFFGWEHNFDDDEYLVYGCDKQWLLAHPEIMEWNHSQLYDEVHKNGGLVVQAHPFRMEDYIPKIRLHPDDVDAIEVSNGGNLPEYNQMAYYYASKIGKPMTSGGDVHHFTDIAKHAQGMITDHPLKNISDYVSLIRMQTGSTFEAVLSTDIERAPKYVELKLPLERYNREQQIVSSAASQRMTFEAFKQLI